MLIIILSTSSSIAQNTKLDSLKNLLDQHPTEDTVRVNLLNDISHLLQVNEPDKSLNRAEKALKLADKINFKKGKVQSLEILGSYYNNKSKYPEALENYQKSLTISEEIGYKSGVANSSKH